MDFREAWSTVLDEVQATLAGAGEAEVGKLCDLIASSRAVFVAGEGRSGLVGRCFAMRLMHLGINAHVVGETATPRLEPGDLLVAISGSGETPFTCAAASLAAQDGGRVVAVTAAGRSNLAAAASVVVVQSHFGFWARKYTK